VRLNVFAHPIRALQLAVRRWTLANDDLKAQRAQPVPDVFRDFRRGELLPFKGVHLRVAEIVGGAFPAIILVPLGPTRGAKLRALRRTRDHMRAVIAEQAAIEKAVHRATR
jgi:hypothetical protein